MSEADLTLQGFARARAHSRRKAVEQELLEITRLEAFAEELPTLSWAHPKSVSTGKGYLRDASLQFNEASRELALVLLDAFPAVALNKYDQSGIVSFVPVGREAEAKVEGVAPVAIAPLLFRFTFSREEIQWWTLQGGLLTNVTVVIETAPRTRARARHSNEQLLAGTFIWDYEGLPEGTRIGFGALRGSGAGDVAVHWAPEQNYREMLLMSTPHRRRS